MAEKRGGLSIAQGLRTTVEVQLGGAWYEVDGVGSMSYTAGQRGEAQVQGFQGNRALLGDIPVTAVTFPITAYMPNDWVWGQIYAAYVANSNLQWRVTTPEDVLFKTSAGTITAEISTVGVLSLPKPADAAASGNAAAITAVSKLNGGSGHANFGGSGIQRNSVIKFGSVKHTIRQIDIDADGKVTAGGVIVRPFPSPAQAAGVYSVVLPSIQIGPFDGKVRATNSMEIGSDEGSVLASTLEITPSGLLPRGVIA